MAEVQQQQQSDDYDLTLPDFYSVKADNDVPIATVEGSIKYVSDAPTGPSDIEDETMMSHMINALTFVQLSEPVTNLSIPPLTIHTYKDPHISTRTLTYVLGDMEYITKLIPEAEFTPIKRAVQKVYTTLNGINDFQQRIDTHLKHMWCSMPMHDKYMLNSPILVHLFGNMSQPYPIYTSPFAMARELLALIVLCESSINDAAIPKSYLPDDKERASKYVKDVGRAYEAQLNQLNMWFHSAMKNLLKIFPSLLETMWKLPGTEAQLQALVASTNGDEKQKDELVQKFWLAAEAQRFAEIPLSTSAASDSNTLTMNVLVKQVLPQFELILNRVTLAKINLMEAKILNLLGWTCNYPSALAAQRQYSMVWPTINAVGSSEYLTQVPKVWRCFFTKHAANTSLSLQRKFWNQQLHNTVSLPEEKKLLLLSYIATEEMDNLWIYATLANTVHTTMGHMALLQELYRRGGQADSVDSSEMLSPTFKDAVKTALETVDIDAITLCWQRAMISELQVFAHKFMR